MRIVILRSAVEDIAQGREFYEQQGEGLGDYFEESLAADIDSLRLYAGIHMLVHGYHRRLTERFPYAIYYELAGEQTGYELFWTVAVPRSGSVHESDKDGPTTASTATMNNAPLRSTPFIACHVTPSGALRRNRPLHQFCWLSAGYACYHPAPWESAAWGSPSCLQGQNTSHEPGTFIMRP